MTDNGETRSALILSLRMDPMPLDKFLQMSELKTDEAPPVSAVGVMATIVDAAGDTMTVAMTREQYRAFLFQALAIEKSLDGVMAVFDKQYLPYMKKMEAENEVYQRQFLDMEDGVNDGADKRDMS